VTDRSTLPSHGVTAYKSRVPTGAAPILIVWGGHFCPPVLTLTFDLEFGPTNSRPRSKSKAADRSVRSTEPYRSFVTVTSS